MKLESTRALRWMRMEEAELQEFAPEIIKVQRQPPSPLPRMVLYTLLTMFSVLLVWMFVGQLDIVTVAQGKLVPQSFLKIVQPAESGIVRAILVKEGDTVREGQPLIRMDARLSEADSRVLQAELHRKRLQVRRIEAELANTPLRRQLDDPADIYAQVEAQYHARRQAYLDAVGAEQATLLKAQHDLQSAVEIQAKLHQSIPIYREQAESWDKLAKEGFAGRLLALERRRIYVESEQDLKAQTQNVASLRAVIAQSDNRITQITSNYRQQLQNERGEAEALYHKLQQDWDKQLHRNSLLELKAPQAGIVKDLATHTPGTVVAPGTILLTLVPQDEPLIAEVWVGNMDSGFVRASQKARIKFAAYPFQKYGLLDGVVRKVGADAQEKPEANGSQVRSVQEAAYRAQIELSQSHLESHGRKLRLVPGMQVNAEIHLGTRSVIEYLLSPVQRIAHEAGRER